MMIQVLVDDEGPVISSREGGALDCIKMTQHAASWSCGSKDFSLKKQLKYN